MEQPSISPTSGPVVPTPDRNPIGYRIARAVLGPLVRLLYRIEVQGLEQVPNRGPVILAANHRSFMDSIFLAVTSPRPIVFVAKGEYFQHRATRWLFTTTGQIPLPRGNPAGTRRALRAASKVLDHDGVVGIYPEGTRSRDGALHRGHRGPALLASGCDAPIVPVGLVGTEAVQRRGQRLPRPFRTVRVRYGPPRRVCGDERRGRRRGQLQQATDELMHDIAALSEQHYCDQYTPTG